jgi:site-specific recombinase XerD
LLHFLRRGRRKVPAELPLKVLNVQTVVAFLNHLEKERSNSVRSRNARLAAIRSFVHYAADLLGPELLEPTHRILAIPLKRHSRPILGFLTDDEVQAILSATDSSWTGRRDHLLFLLLYNTGARVSELLALRVRDVQAGDGRHLLLHGKGRKERQIPLWRSAQRRLRQWIKDNHMTAEAPVLPNRFGQPLSRSGVAWQLRKLISKAELQKPSLNKRRISPHTFRHGTAMHLLKSGVAPEVIALWLGHESPNTTHGYVEADLEMKRRMLEALHPPKLKRTKREPADQLLRFLQDL